MGVKREILTSLAQFESHSSTLEQNAVRSAHELREHLLSPASRQTGGKNSIWNFLGKTHQEIPGNECCFEGEVRRHAVPEGISTSHRRLSRN